MFAHVCDYLSDKVLKVELLDQSVSTVLRILILRGKLPSRKSVLIYISNPAVSDSQALFSVASLWELFTASASILLVLNLQRWLWPLCLRTLPQSSLSFSATGSPSIDLPIEQWRRKMNPGFLLHPIQPGGGSSSSKLNSSLTRFAFH